MDTNYIIETKNLTKQYGSQKSVADLNIHVKRTNLWSSRQKRSRKNHYHENAVRFNEADFRESQNLGKVLARETKKRYCPVLAV